MLEVQICNDHEDIIKQIYDASGVATLPPESPIVVRWALRGFYGNDTESGLLGQRWNDLDVFTLRSYGEGLRLFTPRAWHYYLPAYLIGSLDENADVLEDQVLRTLDPYYNEISSDVALPARLPKLSEEEKVAVLNYLRHLWDKHRDNYHEEWLRSVLDFWELQVRTG